MLIGYDFDPVLYNIKNDPISIVYFYSFVKVILTSLSLRDFESFFNKLL